MWLVSTCAGRGSLGKVLSTFRVFSKRNSVTRNRARKIAISVPYSDAVAVPVVVVLTNVIVRSMGLGIKVVVAVIMLVSVTGKTLVTVIVTAYWYG